MDGGEVDIGSVEILKEKTDIVKDFKTKEKANTDKVVWTPGGIENKDQGELNNIDDLAETDDHIEDIHDFTPIQKHWLEEDNEDEDLEMNI